MSKPITIILLLMLILFADALSIQQTIQFWQGKNVSKQDFYLLPVIIAQISVAAGLLACGFFIFYKNFAGKI